MRQRILGFICVVWGTAVLVYGLTGHFTPSNGAYRVGEIAALVFAGVMVVVGARALLKDQP